MNILEAVANWYGCPYGIQNCRKDCDNYLMLDPRTDSVKGIGPSTKGQRTLCSLLDDLDKQVKIKSN